jgi:serine O-acetyltransferase
MATKGTANAPSYQSLMFSDFARYRPTTRPSWLGILILLPIHPGLVASLVLRAQQCLVRAGHVRSAWALRTLGNALVGADFVPGVEVGHGIMLSHPVGVVLGPGSKIGRDATLASGVVLGVSRHDNEEADDYPVIGDDVFLGAHAAILGDVLVGDKAIVGANAVVTSTVAPNTMVAGNPARQVGTRPAGPG